jgi:hypothetical protein
LRELTILKGVEKSISKNAAEHTLELRPMNISERLDNRGLLIGYYSFTIYLSIRDEDLLRPDVARKTRLCRVSCDCRVKSMS